MTADDPRLIRPRLTAEQCSKLIADIRASYRGRTSTPAPIILDSIRQKIIPN